jgi:HlyD family secretion protein
MRAAWKIAGILIVAGLLVGTGAFWLIRQPETAEAEEAPPTAVAALGSIEETVSATGSVSTERQATLAFETGGPIAEVLVESGQQVKAGQLLARLDTSSLGWQVARAEAALETAQARLAQAQQPPGADEITSAQAALDSALANYERVSAGATAEELASARAALDSARASYRSVRDGPSQEELSAVQAAVDSATATVRQAQAAYDRVKGRADLEMLPESLNLQNATIELERAQANYNALANRPLASDLAAAEAQVAQAEAQLALLLERPIDSELSAAEAQIAQAEAQLAQLRERPRAEDVAVFRGQVEEASLALDQARAQVDETQVTAPFAGTVLEALVAEGEWASPGAPAIILAATDSLILNVNVDEVDVAKLADGQTVNLSFDALNDQQAEAVSGRIARIAPASSNVNGAVAYGVEIGFQPGELPIRLGMTADVDIVVARADEALLVPNRAITADRAAGRYFVELPGADGTTERREVQVGIRNESQTQIMEGLDEGTEIVLPEVPGQSAEDDESRGPFGGGGPFGE